MFFGGVFKVLIPDNASAIVADADAVNPRFTAGWLDYAQHCGFATDPARVRSPKDKPRVERAVQYVRGNFFAGEHFTGLADAQARGGGVVPGRGRDAHPRHHPGPPGRGVRRARGRRCCCRCPLPYDVPVFTPGEGAPRLPRRGRPGPVFGAEEYLGCHLDARADSALVKLFHRGQLVKAHPRQQPGRRVDRPGRPARGEDHLRDARRRLAGQRTARRHGDAIGVYADRLLDTDLPWTKMRQVYRLLGLVRRYGPGPVDTACAAGPRPRRRQRHQDRLDAGEGDREHAPAAAPGGGRHRPVRPRPRRVPGQCQLTLIPGGKQATR